MLQQNIDTVMSALIGKIPVENMAEVEQMLQTADDEKVEQLIQFPLKSSAVMMLVAILGGSLGIDRFLLGKTTQGIIKLITFGGCGIWLWVSIFTIAGETRRYNLAKIKEIITE